jgi:hypothetical protein
VRPTIHKISSNTIHSGCRVLRSDRMNHSKLLCSYVHTLSQVNPSHPRQGAQGQVHSATRPKGFSPLTFGMPGTGRL